MGEEKYEYKTLENIEEKIRKVLNKLGVKIEKPVKQSIKNQKNFYILFTEYEGQKVVFKARLADHRVLKQWGKSFQNERRFYKTLAQGNFESSLTQRIPYLVNTQSKDLEWLMYKHIDEKPLGPDCCHSPYPKKEEALKIIDLIKDIQGFPIDQFRNKHDWARENIKVYDFFYYRDYFTRIVKTVQKDISPFLTKDLIKKAAHIIYKNRDILGQNASLLTHGDLTPANIFIDEKAMAIDWETLHIDNAAHDIATLWFRTGDHLEWRKFLLTEFLKVTKQKKDFETLFRLNVLCRMPGEMAIWINEAKKYSQESLEYIQTQKLIAILFSNFLSALKADPIVEYA